MELPGQDKENQTVTSKSGTIDHSVNPIESLTLRLPQEDCSYNPFDDHVPQLENGARICSTPSSIFVQHNRNFLDQTQEELHVTPKLKSPTPNSRGFESTKCIKVQSIDCGQIYSTKNQLTKHMDNGDTISLKSTYVTPCIDSTAKLDRDYIHGTALASSEHNFVEKDIIPNQEEESADSVDTPEKIVVSPLHEPRNLTTEESTGTGTSRTPPDDSSKNDQADQKVISYSEQPIEQCETFVITLQGGTSPLSNPPSKNQSTDTLDTTDLSTVAAEIPNIIYVDNVSIVPPCEPLEWIPGDPPFSNILPKRRFRFHIKLNLSEKERLTESDDEAYEQTLVQI